MKPWERFLEKYAAWGKSPTVDGYVALFDDEASLLHPGIAEPIGREKIPGFITRSLSRLPKFQFFPIHWSFRDDTIFVEAQNVAEPRGTRIVWPSVYCITLRDDRVLRGRAYYDRTEVLLRFEPEFAKQAENAHTHLLDEVAPAGGSSSDADVAAETYERIIAPYTENWKHPEPHRFADFYSSDARMINPGFERPLRRDELAQYYIGLTQQTQNLQLQLQTWAASPGLLYCEWLATGNLAGKPIQLPVVDRFSLDDYQATEGVAYFDALALRAVIDPSAARVGDVSTSSPALAG